MSRWQVDFKIITLYDTIKAGRVLPIYQPFAQGVNNMLIGILFIAAGIVIALYPPLLSFIVAAVMIFIGISFVIISYHYRKMTREFSNPYLDFFMRF